LKNIKNIYNGEKKTYNCSYKWTNTNDNGWVVWQVRYKYKLNTSNMDNNIND